MKRVALGVVVAAAAASGLWRLAPPEEPSRVTPRDVAAPVQPAAAVAEHASVAAGDDETCAADEARAELAERLDATLTPRETVRRVSGFASDTVRGALADEARFPDLASCRASAASGSACAQLEAEALAAVLTWPLRDQVFRDTYHLARLEDEWGRDLLRERLVEAVEDAYATEQDAAARLAALALLEAVEAPDPRPLDPSVYAALAERPAAEAGMLLDQFERAPVGTDRVQDEIFALATGAHVAPALRLRAVESLALAAAPGDLADAIDYLDEDGLLDREAALTRVAPALVRCGAACADQLDALARSENPAARLAALTAVARLEPDLRAQVLEQLVVAFEERGDLDALERDQLAYLTRSVGR
ncbi:MAG: hypothetical protein QNK04_09685 [Myxococcota bacterium]|nr:hypothetical protein [Myxococcota bacterium]